jgi:DNA-binding IclR family transcriptional regulator
MAQVKSSADASNFDIQSVSRVGQILALFGPLTTELTAADVAERLNLNRTTAYRYCTSMVAAGLLERGRRRGAFTLGALLMQLGIQSLGRQRVVEAAPPHLTALSSDVGATAVLSLWGTTGPVVALVREDTSRTVVVTVRAGSQLGVNSAQMRVFLAYLPDADVVERMTVPLSDAERTEIESDVYAARRTGYSTLKLPDGIFSAAAPVFDDNGICATVALLAAEQGFPPGSPALNRLLATAHAISAELTADR